MGYFLAGLLILVILWYVISALRPRGEAPHMESADDVTACPVRLTLLAVNPLEIDPERLMADYQMLWDETLTCAPQKAPPGAPPTYRLSKADEIAEVITEKYNNLSVELHSGGQPVYYYLISVE